MCRGRLEGAGMDPVIGTGSRPPYPRKYCVNVGQYLVAVVAKARCMLTLGDSFPGRSWHPLGSGMAYCCPILAVLDTVLFVCRLPACRTLASFHAASRTGRTLHLKRMPTIEAPALKRDDL